LKLKEAFDYYHYGASSSTGGDYNGVDMRGEVILLTRNIVVEGTSYDDWGGTILT
jgi:hypothetical protein